MSLIYDALNKSTANKFNNYMWDLQSKWGDPRVYASQQQAMRRHEAAVMYDSSRDRTKLLADAYQQQVARNRENHEKRLTSKKSKHPQSAASAPDSRTPAPPRASADASAPASRDARPSA